MSLAQEEPLYVSVTEAKRLLGFKDRRTIYKLIRRGYLKARKINDKTFRVNYASIKAFTGEVSE